MEHVNKLGHISVVAAAICYWPHHLLTHVMPVEW